MTSSNNRNFTWMAVLTAIVALATFGIVALLVNIMERKQEARTPFVKLVELSETSTVGNPGD